MFSHGLYRRIHSSTAHEWGPLVKVYIVHRKTAYLSIPYANSITHISYLHKFRYEQPMSTSKIWHGATSLKTVLWVMTFPKSAHSTWKSPISSIDAHSCIHTMQRRDIFCLSSFGPSEFFAMGPESKRVTDFAESVYSTLKIAKPESASWSVPHQKTKQLESPDVHCFLPCVVWRGV